MESARQSRSRAVRALTLVVAALATPPGRAAAQEVTITIGLFNPTPSMADWSAKPGMGGLTVTNTTGFDVDLTVTATLLTAGTRAAVGQASSDITVIPSTASQYYPLPDIARWTQMTFSGAVKQAVQQSGRLPEGSYWLRITFSNMSANGRGMLDVSDSTFFTITFPQPPKLIAPANGSAVPAPYPVFQWTPVIAPGMLVGYAVRVAEVLPGQTPLQAVQANVPLFDAPVSVATSVLYPPAAYPLEAGSTYAWRVQAITYNPLEFEPPLPVGANNGFSEIFTFKYAPPTVGVVVVPAQPPPPKPPGPIVAQGGQPPFNRVLTGKLDYSFNASDVPTPKKIALAYAGQLPIIPLMEAGGGDTPTPGPAGGFVQPGGGPSSIGPPGPSRRPLAGVTVRLVVRYRTLTKYILAGPIIAGGKVYADNGKVVATTTTGSDGKFTFLFHDDLATGTLAVGTQVKWGSGDVAFGTEANTSLGRFYQLQVGDPHYLNPSDELTTSATQFDVGPLVSLVRSYSVVVRALKFGIPGAGTPPQYLGSVRVQLLRHGRPTPIPATEGPSNAWPRPTINIAPVNGYEILGEGETNGTGSIRFRRLVKNVGPNDEYRVRLYTTDVSGLNYETAIVSYKENWGLGANKPFDYATFNEQYNTQLEDTLVVLLLPRKPRITVTVQRSDNGAPLPYGKVDLCFPGVCLRQWLDDDPKHAGTVVWHDLMPKAGTWRIDVGQPGYLPATQEITTPEMGRSYKYTIPMAPDAILRGRIVDETGAPVSGKARVANGPEKNALPVIVGHTLTAWEFKLTAPSGQQELHITPPPNWFPLDTTITIAKGDNPVRTFTVLRRLHRLRLVVRPYVAMGNVMVAQPGQAGGGGPTVLAAARVELKPKDGATSDIQVKTANAQGVVEFLWASTSNDAELRVTGPTTADYQLATPTLTVPVSPSTAFHQDTVYLQPGTRLTGRVYAGTGTATPVGGARVSVVVNGAVHDTLTGPGGEYTLRRVPLGSISVRATKSLSNYIGDSLQVNAVTPSVTGVDFHLQFYEGINIARLLGFPLEVYSLQTLADNRIRISGALVDAPANAVFAVQSPVEPFKFDSVTVEAGPGNAAVPSAGSVHLSFVSDLALDVYGKDLSGVQHTAGGLRARPTASGAGAVYGAIHLGPLKGLTTGQVSGLPELYLLQPGATGEARTVLASITADSTSPAGPQGYNVGTATGGAPHFGLIGFSTDVDPVGTFLRPDGIHFKATLHTNIPGAGDLALAVPDIHYALGQGFQASQNDQALSAKLGLWTIAATPWSVSVQAGRVYFQKGEIHAPLNPNKPDATVNFPFTALEVTPTGFSGGNFNAGPIKLAGFLPLDPAGSISLTALPAEGAWKLVTAGTIKNLPGTRPTDQVELSVFEVRSNGPANLAPKADQVVRFYETADFTVLGLYVTDAAVSLDGKLDLIVPNLAEASFLMRYEPGPGGAPKLVPPPLSFAAFDIGGPQLTLTNGTLDASGFKSAGSLAVPGKFTIPVTFLRSPLTGTNRIEATPTAAAQIALGEILVTQLTGGAKVESGWKTVVGGQLDVNNGQVSGKISLEVAGSDVSIGSAGLSVKNISTPFGDLKLTINFPESRVDGALQFNTDLAAGAHANGAAELAISGKPGNRYWYFFGGADFALSTPHLGGVAALLVGDAQLSGALLDKFASYSNKGVPESFHDIEGFFLGGKIEVPIPSCPNGAFDVGIANVAVWCTGWGDLQFGMNFNSNNVYHIGVEVGVEAGAKGGGGLGACLHVSGKAKVHAGMVGAYRSDGAWFVQGDYGFDLEGEVSGGVGIDDKCIEKSTGFTLSLGAKAQLGHNFNDNTGSYFEVYWK